MEGEVKVRDDVALPHFTLLFKTLLKKQFSHQKPCHRGPSYIWLRKETKNNEIKAQKFK